jgi:hypothetical protein
MNDWKYVVYDYITGCKHETSELTKLLQLIRDLTLEYGDFAIKFKERSNYKGVWYIVYEIKK